MIPTGCPSAPHWQISSGGHGICTKCLPTKKCEQDFANSVEGMPKEEFKKLFNRNYPRKKEKKMTMTAEERKDFLKLPVEERREELSKQVAEILKEEAVPPKPVTKNLHLIGEYYQENKERIIRDCNSIGKKEACKKWGILSSNFSKLNKKWHFYGPQYYKLPTGVMPAWEEMKSESDVVKVRWLELVSEMKEK